MDNQRSTTSEVLPGNYSLCKQSKTGVVQAWTLQPYYTTVMATLESVGEEELFRDEPY